jgi:hypothetical protein
MIALRALVAAALLSIAATALGATPRSPIISLNPDGQLRYERDSRGNRVPDFSSCGYAGADRAIPDAQVRVVIAPIAGDSTERIQRAVNYVASLPSDSNGVRGAVLLLRGRHEVFGGLWITNSGVTLRGQGMGENGTTLVAAGTDRRTLIRILGRDDCAVRSNDDWQIADEYVPVGTVSFRLRNATALKPGAFIRVIRPSTQAWIESLNATEFGGGIGGGWKPGSRNIVWDRTVKSVEGNLVTIDAPITTALETAPARSRGDGSQIAGAEKSETPHVVLCDWPGRVSNVGVENLALESTFDAANPKDENHSWCAITLENVRDTWVRQVTFKYFAGSAVAVYESGSRITVQDCLSRAPVSEEGGYRRHTFFTMGQQTLFLRCYAEKGRHDFSVGHCAAGPNAFVQCEASEALEDSGAIESWASGILYDNVNIDGNALTLGRRDSGAWAAANSVLWQSSASVIRCESPPGAQNWAFGCWAEFIGNGIWRGANDFVSPDSLYEGQLRDRLAVEAAGRLKLMPRPREESSNPTVEKAQELAAAAHQPARLLRDYIADAAKREPLVIEPGKAKRIEEIARPPTATVLPRHPLIITNGWLTAGGKLLIGGSANVTWWRGSIRPDEAASFGLGVTRFVPGREGAGFTDDLTEVADKLVASGKAALDHNYGLWYDRRRDDHERVRRMDGDVLPPFYEQPFARSGEGTAWLGLSKYDLTKFNPWYWSRLRKFAGLCDERGLVLFHQNYFQHNILEAGAHWADSPWRSANNINRTGFPEPPPYAGDKRIFQAELFYDVSHPVRRRLHEGYIRQCLDNFTNNVNVIQFTSAEFTGPLPFVEFWLDTISEWEREHVAQTSKSAVSQVSKPAWHSVVQRADLEIGGTAGLVTCATPIIALSATKDVQDAILADHRRNAVVDVIDFRYWWQTDKGLFAPPGGKNLAPRQFERQWRGGRPGDVNLAQMAAEYRGKFPAKVLLCDFDTAAWAWVCAGGSLPRLPRTTDAKLLAAIPRMQPWRADAEKKFWALREPGKGFLIYCGDGGGAVIDLTGEQGTFAVNLISADGVATSMEEHLTAGSVVTLKKPTHGPAVFWLTKD